MTAALLIYIVIGINIDEPVVKAAIAKHKSYLSARKDAEERMLIAKQSKLSVQRRTDRGDPALSGEVSALISSIAKLNEHLFAIDDNWVGAVTYNYRCVNDALRNNYSPAVGDIFTIESEFSHKDNLSTSDDRGLRHDDLYLVGFIRSGEQTPGENADISRIPVVVNGLNKDNWHMRAGIYIVLRIHERQPVIEKIDGTGRR